jgi:hypothetical protein
MSLKLTNPYILWLATHGGQPFQDVKDLPLFPILRLVNDLGFFWDAGHPLLRERGTDNIISTCAVRYLAAE